jgi:hypothetical protein
MPDNDLKSILRGWFVGNERYGERYGFLGKIVSGSYVVETGDGRVWVTLEDGTALKAINKKVARKPGIKVVVKPNRDGEMEIAGLQSAQTVASAGNNGSAVSNLETPPHQHFIGSGLEDPVESRRFMPGLLHAFSGLTLYIEAFPFRYNGVDYRWPGGPYDISGDLPATTDYWAWVKVGINPATNTAVADTSTEKPLRSLLQLSDLDAIDFATAGYIPCGGVIVQEGQTAGPLEADFAESREFLNAGGTVMTATRPIIVTGSVISIDAQPLLRAFMGI